MLYNMKSLFTINSSVVLQNSLEFLAMDEKKKGVCEDKNMNMKLYLLSGQLLFGMVLFRAFPVIISPY